MALLLKRLGRSNRYKAHPYRISWKLVLGLLFLGWPRAKFAPFASRLRRIRGPRFIKVRERGRITHDQSQDRAIKLNKAVLDVLPSHICILDKSGNILAVNRHWMDFAEANSATLTKVCEGTNYLAACDTAKGEPTAAAVASALRALISGSLPEFAIEYPCHSPTEERWFVARGYRYFDDNAVRIVVAHKCVTDRKLAERSARQSEDRYRNIIEEALDGVYGLDSEGRFSLINDAACMMTGYPRSELIGMDVRQVLAPECHAQFEIIWQKLMHGGVDQSEWQLIRKDGSRVFVEVRSRMQPDSHVVGFARDVTERKEAETLRQARDAAEAANRTKDEFLAMLSHELRTPLAPVLIATRMIEQDLTLPEHVRELAVTIHRNIEIQAHLIDDLLDQTRIARGKMELHPKVVSIDAVVDHVLRIFEADFVEKNLRVHVERSVATPHVRADEARLQQILWNLLKNAVKFTPHNGGITIRIVTPAVETVRIEVGDSGVGIDPEIMPKLFRPFEQGGTATTRRFGGLGLGLAISEKLARLHGGTLTAHSEGKNQGATFILQLPTVREGIETPSHTPDIKARAAEHKLAILLVEDHLDTARILARLLERRGHSVQICNCVHDAEARANSEHFDLVLSDIDLPDGTGYDLMHFLQTTHPVPGIAMSGFGMEQDVNKSRNAGFAEHLVKPVDPSRLEEAIEHVVAGTT